ncbi:MAG: hypothetical protein LBU15_00360 [Rickettsiales bacterium]|jgi:hypothetical protein|nr:hypothetical protein [Rickettsiales bacterium]
MKIMELAAVLAALLQPICRPERAQAEKCLNYRVGFIGGQKLELFVSDDMAILDNSLGGGGGLKIITTSYNGVKLEGEKLEVKAGASEAEVIESLEYAFGSKISEIDVEDVDCSRRKKRWDL